MGRKNIAKVVPAGVALKNVVEKKLKAVKDNPVTKAEIEARKRMKQRNLSVLTLFTKNWNMKDAKGNPLMVDPEENISESLIRTLTSLSMPLYVFSMAVVILNYNLALYLLYFLANTLVAQEASRFLRQGNIATNIWSMILSPLFQAAILILILACHQSKGWSRMKHTFIMFFRYLLILTFMGHSGVCICYWAWKIDEISGFVRPFLEESFQIYISTEDAGVTNSWEFTQKIFECCGFHSFRDFDNTKLEAIGVRQCFGRHCNPNNSIPIITKAYPLVCCDTTIFACITHPREEQCWQEGCLDRTVVWIKIMLSIMVSLTIITFIIGVTTAVFYIIIDVHTYRNSMRQFRFENFYVVNEYDSDEELRRKAEVANEEAESPENTTEPIIPEEKTKAEGENPKHVSFS